MKKIFYLVCTLVFASANMLAEECVPQSLSVAKAEFSLFAGGKLPGEFSVADEKYVSFSQGNLQYQASTNIWRFAPNQWSYSTDNAQISSTFAGWIDLFGFGTSGYNGKDPYMTSTSGDDYVGSDLTGDNKNYDWGHNAISNGGNTPDTWRTLTADEWDYLINRNTAWVSKGQVNDVKGLILLPDNWDWSTVGLTAWTPQTGDNYSNTYYTKGNASFTEDNSWNKMQSAGAVFLPLCGERIGTTVTRVQTATEYWSSTVTPQSNGTAYYLHVYSDGIINKHGAEDAGCKSWGCSVRLVKDVVK